MFFRRKMERENFQFVKNMNRFILYIHWVDAKIVYNTLTSIQNAYNYSTKDTEFIIVLNEQTFTEEPIIDPKDMWKEFINHPFISKCKIKKITNDDKIYGSSKCRIEFYNKNGLTYWGESDCLLPLEFFYITENFQNVYKDRPYIMTFSSRKMWDGWEQVEHPLCKNLSTSPIPNKITTVIDSTNFLRFDGPMSLDLLYKFNDNQGDPEIVLLPIPRVEATLLTLSDNLSENLICPALICCHEDWNLEILLKYYNIPQFHVKNILKGHDTGNSNKRINIKSNPGCKIRSEKFNDLQSRDKELMISWINKHYSGEFK
jgi:hypothetical protein